MLIGVLLGVAAGALWGLIYLAPLMVPEYNPILLALGRFVVYGLVSLPFLWIFRRELAKFTRRDFFDAFWMPMVGNIIFYALLTSSIRLSGAPLAGMLMATIPVLVAVVSNIRYAAHGRAAPWRRVVPPVMLIFGGLVFANWSEFELLTQTAGEEGFWEGAGLGVLFVIAWTWFSIANAEWLVANPEKSPYAWTALQGVMILPVASILFIVGAGPFGMLDTSAGLLGPAPVRFLLVLLMLGTLCSWLAMICWNSMSQRLPSALSGQLIVFESIFAVVYALIYRGETPALTMIAGFIVLLVGVLGSLRAFRMPIEPHGPKKTHPVRAAQ